MLHPRVWRIHGLAWDADDATGAVLSSGRWNRGLDQFPQSEVIPLVYTSTAPDVATWEYLRHSPRHDGEEAYLRLKKADRSWMDVSLPRVLDLRDPTRANVTLDALTGSDYSLPQAIAAAAYGQGLAGILAPSAAKIGAASGDFNVMIFFELTGATRPLRYGFLAPDSKPRPGTRITVLGHEPPDLP